MNVRRVAAPLVLGLVGLAAGYAIGHRQGLDMGMEFLSTEVRGGMVVHANALCSLRLGDTEVAAHLLESMLDNAACNLSQQQTVAELSAESRRALAAAKVYRTAYPSRAPNPLLDRILAEIPYPEFSFCSNPSGEGCGLDKVVSQRIGR